MKPRTRNNQARSGEPTPNALRGVALAVLLLACAAPGQSLDELLELEPAKPAAPEQEIAPQTVRKLTDEQAQDAFRSAVTTMDDAAERLGGKLDAGLDTQRLQQEILEKLDMVIQAAKQRKSSNSSSSSGQSSKPQQQDRGSAQNQSSGSTGAAGSAAGAGGQGENQGQVSNPSHPGEAQPTVMREDRREWGHLPPRLREELMQGLSEKFSPLYQSLTEAYYKRLAEEGR